MENWYNPSGHPLSSTPWLTAHHEAKRTEREAFCEQILLSNPTTIVDIGCGPGLWLDLLDRLAPPGCKLIGIDADQSSIEEAKGKAVNWQRESEWITDNLERSADRVPRADVILIFNILSYVPRTSEFLESLAARLNPGGRLIIRQFDGESLQFGPMNSRLRLELFNSLYSSVGSSRQFRHFEMDDTFETVHTSHLNLKSVEFDNFQRVSPFPKEFIPYALNTLNWIQQHISESLKADFEDWRQEFWRRAHEGGCYFRGSDLVVTIMS